MSEILQKYKLLNKANQKEVIGFIDSLLNKKRTRRKNTLDDYKKKILSVSTWSESDMKVFEESEKYFQQWRVEEW